MTSLNINLELFEKYQTIGKCIRYNGKESEKLKINIYKHELVYSANAYRRRWVARNAMHKIAKSILAIRADLKNQTLGWFLAACLFMLGLEWWFLPGPSHYGIVVIESFEVLA